MPIGTKFGKLTVVEFVGINKKNSALYLCKCDCGKEKVAIGTKLRVGRTKSCGCINIKDLMGFEYATFTVDMRVGSDKNRNALWKATCSCGYEEVRSSESLQHIKSGNNQNAFRCPQCQKAARDKEVTFNYVIGSYRQGAKRRNLDFLLTDEEFGEYLKQDCYYCGAKPSSKQVGSRLKYTIEYNGIDRLDNTLSYSKDNCVSCCTQCNYGKRDLSVSEYIEHCRRVVCCSGSVGG